MLKKFFIIGLFIFSAGLAAVGFLAVRERNWSKMQADYKSKYSSNNSDYMQQYQLWLKIPEYQRSEFPWNIDANSSLGTDEQIKQHQKERFIADVDNLNNIDAGLYPIAKLLYGDDWQKRLADYNRRQEINRTGFISAVLVSSIGGVMILSFGIALACVRLFGKDKEKDPSQEQAVEEKDKQKPEIKKQQTEKKSIQSILNCHPYSSQATPTDCEDNEPEQDSQQEANLQDNEADKAEIKLQKDTTADKQTDENNKRWWNRPKGMVQKTAQSAQRTKKVVKQVNLAKEQTAVRGEVISETLNKLSEEVAAIRRYAGQQQDKFKNLREGYDWNIIRNFALRVIRCVDNLESRITGLSPDNPVKEHLEEIRDELVFALESSGLERYEPDVNSEFCGHQKTAEAVKEKQHTSQLDLRGKISEVLRSGYRYVIDKENYKVIRAAQVKLFG